LILFLDFVEQAQLFTEATGHRQISISALEEIIHKQTREIQALKCDLHNEKEKNSSSQKDIHLNYSQKLNELLNKLNENENEKNKTAEINEKKLEKILKDHEVNTNKQSKQIQQLSDEKSLIVEKFTAEIQELKQKIEQLESENMKEKEIKNTKIKDLSDEKNKYFNELHALKTYVNDSMPTIDNVEQLLKEKAKFDEQMAKIKSKNENLIKENSALQIRIKSINEILMIQENQLEHSQTSHTSHLVNEKKRLGLLQRWRTKVFELLVQLKSTEINSKLEKNTNEKTLLEYIERLDELANKNKILENVIDDKKAEICVINSDNFRLAEQLSVLKDTQENLEKKCQQDLQSSIELKNFIDTLLNQYNFIEDNFRVANKKLSHLDQRVEFAKNRLCVIKALYTKKDVEELKRCNMLEMTSYLSSIHGSINPNESHIQHQALSLQDKKNSDKLEDKEEELFLRQELEKVTEERNLLANKLKSEMEIIDDKVIRMKTEYEFRIDQLNAKLAELNELNEIKTDQIEKINEALLIKESLYENLTKNHEELQKKFADLRSQLIVDCEKQMKSRELEFLNKIQNLDEKLNESRREQNKAVVIMRQMERSSNREKERLENLLKSCDSYYKNHLEKLQLKMISLEKERNSLLHNLRQNGNLPSISSDESNSIKNHFIRSSNIAANSLSIDQNNFSNHNYSYQETNYTDNQNIEATSFWLDSKSSIEPSNQIEKVNEDSNESDLNKNTEILSQIRKIMGNLELSYVELENEDVQRDDAENQNSNEDHYSYEHVIDNEHLYK